MTTKSPAFQLCPSEWLSSTAITLMRPHEEGALVRLMCHMWAAEDCGLPDDDEVLAQLSRLGEGWFKGSATTIKKCFKKVNGRLYHESLLDERKRQNLWRKKSAEGGTVSGIRRKQNRINQTQSEGWLPNGMNQKATKGQAVPVRVVQPNSDSSSESEPESTTIECAEEPKPEKPERGKSQSKVEATEATEATETPAEENKKKLPPIPECLNTPEFRAVWRDWVKMRNASKFKMTPTIAKLQFKKLARYEVDVAIEIVELSISSNWRGIFDDRFEHLRKPEYDASMYDGDGNLIEPPVDLSNARFIGMDGLIYNSDGKLAEDQTGATAKLPEAEAATEAETTPTV